MRTAAVLAALACAATGLTATAAHADGVPYVVSGQLVPWKTVPCTDTAPYPWMGNALSPSLRVDGGSGIVTVRLKMWENDPSSPVLEAASQIRANSAVSFGSLPMDRFSDGGSYAWSAQAEGSEGITDWTAPCRFSVDKTPPPTPALDFTDNHPDGTLPGVTRTARFTVPAGAEVARYCFLLGGWEPTCEGEGAVAAGPDGSADFSLVTPDDGGRPYAVLRFYAIDRAGQRSTTVERTFPVQQPPPPTDGDYTGDLKADALAVGTDGKLHLYPGIGDGTFGPGVVADSRDWSGVKVARSASVVGTDGQTGTDGHNDIFAVRNGQLLVYPGNGHGGFGDPIAVQSGHDWSNVDAITAIKLNWYQWAVLTREGDHLWVHNLTGWAAPALSQSTDAGAGWQFKDIAATNVDVNGDDLREILVRDRLSGSLSLYPSVYDSFTGQLGGFDTPVAIAATGWDAVDRPQFVGLGALQGTPWSDTNPIDLLTTTTSDGLTAHPVAADGAPGMPVDAAPSGFGIGVRLF